MNNKIVVIHQPDFLPYLGFFHRLLHADLYVILDHVQFSTTHGSKGKWHNRDKIKTPGREKWLTLPVKKEKQPMSINQVEISNAADWKFEHMRLINQNYRKAQFFQEVMPYITKIYDYDCLKLIDFNINALNIMMELFNIKIEVVMSNHLEPEGSKNELVVDILEKVRATTYLSGTGAKDYYDPEPYQKAGIDVVFQEFVHPVYPQLYGEFIPYLSSIDLLFNCGIEKSREILRSI